MQMSGSDVLRAKMALRRNINENIFDLQRINHARGSATDESSKTSNNNNNNSSGGGGGGDNDDDERNANETDSLVFDHKYYRVFGLLRLASLLEEHRLRLRLRHGPGAGDDTNADDDDGGSESLARAYAGVITNITDAAAQHRHFSVSQKEWQLRVKSDAEATEDGDGDTRGESGVDAVTGAGADTKGTARPARGSDDRLLAAVLGLPSYTEVIQPWLGPLTATATTATAGRDEEGGEEEQQAQEKNAGSGRARAREGGAPPYARLKRSRSGRAGGAGAPAAAAPGDVYWRCVVSALLQEKLGASEEQRVLESIRAPRAAGGAGAGLDAPALASATLASGASNSNSSYGERFLRVLETLHQEEQDAGALDSPAALKERRLADAYVRRICRLPRRPVVAGTDARVSEREESRRVREEMEAVEKHRKKYRQGA